MQNNPIIFKNINEKYILFLVNEQEHEILLEHSALEQFFANYHTTNIQVGENIFNINQIDNLHLYLKSIAPKPKHLNHIPLALPPKVIGRTKDLEKVEELLFQDHALVIVNGIGGIGKTVLSHYYWQEKQHKYTHLLWLKGEGNLQDSLIYDYNLHAGLGIVEEMKYHLEAIRQPNNAQAKEQAFACIATTLKNVTPKGLMLIDNATDENHWTIKQWKTTFDNFHILVTSRETFANVTTYKLGYLSELEAIELFYLYYDPEDNLPHDDEIVAEIVQKAGYHTLTIELLAMTLQDSDELTLATLAEKLAEHIVYISDKKKVLIDANYTQSRDYIDSIIEFAFDLSRLKKNEYALHLLTQISVLPSYNLRSEHLKQMLVSEGDDENLYSENMKVLWKAGWIERFNDEKGRFYNCHAVVQEVVRGKERVDFDKVERLIKKISSILKGNNKKHSWENEKWFPYTNCLVKDFCLNNGIIQKLFNTIAFALNKIGQYEKAIEFNKKTLLIKEQLLQADDPVNAISFSNMGFALNKDGNYAEAINYHLRALDLRERVLGYEHAKTATTYNNIALVYNNIGKYDLALDYFFKSLKIREILFGANHINVGIVCSNIGFSYNYKGMNEESVTFFNRAVIIKERVHGINSTSVASTYNGLGLAYRDMGNFKESLTFFEKSLNIRREMLGEEHPDTAVLYHNIAVLHKNKQSYEAAIDLLKKSLLIRKKTLSYNHPNIIKSISEYKSILNIDLIVDINVIAEHQTWLQRNFPEYLSYSP